MQLGKHIAGGASFVSNFVLLDERGYFDNASDSKILLHLWSLGIEEQFYLLWPLVLWVAWKVRFNLLALTLGLAATSFAFNIAIMQTDAVGAFYSPHARAWELLAGTALAWLALRADTAGWPGQMELAQQWYLPHLERLHEDRRSEHQPLCLLMCDVDHFKSINDRHGHAVGDEVLTQVAQLLRQHLRDGDQVGRIGGEEFLVVLQSTEPERLAQVGERLRQVVASHPLMSLDTTFSVTLSIGGARSLQADTPRASQAQGFRHFAQADDGVKGRVTLGA